MGYGVKVILLATAMLLLATNVALAVNKRCDGGGCRGTAKADKLYGTPRFDGIYGGRGADMIYGGAGSDDLRGGAGKDVIRAGAGNDIVRGGPGDDKMSGRAGRDRLYGGYGNDVMHGSLDGEKDYFYCGPGRDKVMAGIHDFVARSCEAVEIRE